MQSGPFPIARPKRSIVVASSPEPSPMGLELRRVRRSLRVVNRTDEITDEVTDSLAQRAEAVEVAPQRDYDCPNYDTCLGLAAALDWSSFTCAGCTTRTVNQQLLWRAHSCVRKNPALSRLCKLPVL